MTPFNHVSRRAVQELGGCFGSDKGRRLVVTLEPGSETGDRKDMIVMRPEGTRREHRIAAADVYRIAIQRAANVALLEKARAKKLNRQAARERARLDAAARRFRQKIKTDTHE